ncbi:hypothetical protein KL86PLE_90007 [uncultured Pleomorphomonas sp.]|uniref:Uncharacterized protein n=1 Tax=uncultured Pleomorphomonas sp. TaxID=442121 RepID=A0A212LM84_9HYPH|nr:hypothetical protein KL86PLE_90007 [uncultured Pleomorphomonas sp.]
MRKGATQSTCVLAQFRTCLWLRAGFARAANGGSGEGKPVTGVKPGLSRFSSGGRDLKQRRRGLFWSLPALQTPTLLKRHYFLAGRADWSHPSNQRLHDQRFRSHGASSPGVLSLRS